MSSWDTITMADLIDKGEANLQTGPFGAQLKASEYVESGIPVINVKNIGYGDVREDDLDFVDEKTAHRLRVHRLKAGDIVFGRTGSADRHALIGPAGEGWLQGSDCVRLRLNSKRITSRFLSYYFCTSGHKYWMEALYAFGATMSTLNQGIVRRLSLRLPSVDLQHRIAAILSAYDELIENNKRRITLLEEMAEEIYREWFVRLRFPGHEGVKVVKGVPQGWGRRGLNSLGTYLNGYEPSDWKLEEKPIIKIKEMTSGVTADTPRNLGEDVPAKYHFDDGAVIFSWSATLLVLIWDQGPGLLNQHLFKVDHTRSAEELPVFLRQIQHPNLRIADHRSNNAAHQTEGDRLCESELAASRVA